MAKFSIGIDLGGTFVKAALLSEGAALAAKATVPTPADKGPDGVIDAMAAAARKVMAEAKVNAAEVAGVGIGSPGPLDLEGGVVIGMPNIPGFQNVPIRDRLAKALGMPAVLENDANVAALGELLAGSGQGVRDLVLLTLGTGVGSGIIVDGQLVHGAHGLGGEIGHMIVQPDGEPCGCGQRGCLERYASATYLAQYARRLIEQEGRASSLAAVLAEAGEITGKDVGDARLAGDELAAEVWARAVGYLAVACVTICRMLDPERILFGGGMANAGEELMGPLRARFERLTWNLADNRTSLALASLGNDAGVIGAAGVAWRRFGNG